MEKYYDLLYCMNRKPARSQRALADQLDISVGQVNYLLRSMEEQGCIHKSRVGYELTEKGQVVLEQRVRESLGQRMVLPETVSRPVKAAVILAAGENDAFTVPVGLLPIDGIPVIEHLLKSLANQGIAHFYVVIGAHKEKYISYFRGRNVTLVENKRYPWTGTMESLACVQPLVKQDFLLVEGNQLLDGQGIRLLMEMKPGSGMLLASPSGSSDEAYVELDEQGCIFRIAKDMKQMNRIDAELLGASRISLELYEKMLAYYRKNENPYLNYEYVIENIGRMYRIQGVLADDLVWTVIENEHHYYQAKNLIYPKIQKKERLRKENKAKEVMKDCMAMKEEEIERVSISGGMTNQNFYVKAKGEEYILRLPGACTETMIERASEYHNSLLAAGEGYTPEIPYFDRQTGIKVTRYIQGAQTLNGRTARLEQNMKKTTGILRRLHQSQMDMLGTFDVWKEYRRYRDLAEHQGGEWYPGFLRMEEYFHHLKEELQKLGIERVPCHNDLVPENFVRDEHGRMYLVDWEYAGFNDPMWDVAAHLLESGFSGKEESLFLQYYFDAGPEPEAIQKIAIFKICQDVLWSVWTIAKEAGGEDFGTYGRDRLTRAMEQRKEYEKQYGWK